MQRTSRTHERKTGALREEGSRPFLLDTRGTRGGVMFYIFLAVALLAALTYFFTKDTQTSVSTQMSNKAAQELYVQSNTIRAAIVECTLLYPEGGGDIDADGFICADTSGTCAGKVVDNPNPPFPINPYRSTAHAGLTLATFAGAVGSTADDLVRNVSCLVPPVAPATVSTQQLIFQGAASGGRFLPQPPAGWPEWKYNNDATGVSITVVPPAAATDIAAADLLITKFNTSLCQAEWSGSGTFTVWIQKAACP